MGARRHGEFRRVREKKTNGLASDEWNKAGNAQGVHTESCARARKNAGEIKKIRLSEISPGRETAPQKEASMANKEGRRQKRIRARGMCLCEGIYEIPNAKCARELVWVSARKDQTRIRDDKFGQFVLSTEILSSARGGESFEELSLQMSSFLTKFSLGL